MVGRLTLKWERFWGVPRPWVVNPVKHLPLSQLRHAILVLLLAAAQKAKAPVHAPNHLGVNVELPQRTVKG